MQRAPPPPRPRYAAAAPPLSCTAPPPLAYFAAQHRKVAQYINLYNGIKPHVNTYKFIHCYKDLQGVNLYGVKLYTVYMATPYKTHVKPHVFYTI